MSGSVPQFPLNTEQTVQLLRESGITPTSQRVLIGQTLFAKAQHLSADQLLEKVNTRDASVSKATVYNTLGLFSAKGLIREVLIDPERIFYDSNQAAHYHLYNLDTGDLQDIPAGQLPVFDLPDLPSECVLDSLDIVVKVRNRQP